MGMKLNLDRGLPTLVSWSRILAIVFLAAASFGVYGGPSLGQASAVSLVSSPSKLRSDYDARLASDGKILWLATTGFSEAKEKRLHTQVAVLKDGKWKKLPGSPLSSTDTALQVVARTFPGRKTTEPCVGFTDRRSLARIRCFAGGKWSEKSINKSLRRNFNLEGLTADGNNLTAFFRKIDSSGATRIRVARMKHDRFVPFGPPLRFNYFVLAQFGLKTADVASDRRVDLTVSDLTGNQWVATLTKSKWSRTNVVPRKGNFSLLTGSVRSKGSLFVPSTTDYHSKDWPFSIFRRHAGKWSEVGNAPLSDLDASQGGIDPSGNEVWATWQQQTRPERGLPFPTKQWAARVSPSGKTFDESILLWSGDRNFPGQQQTVEYRGKPAFLYIRQFVNHGPTRATVDLTLQRPKVLGRRGRTSPASLDGRLLADP